ncbi:MAG: hypothetical protein MJE63_14450 [Proteobacteria bacterium]|nr:hypothetical protein [Pseudomonadota bacterium]
MFSKVIQNRDRLLEIAERKSRLLQSVIDQFDHIETNPVFIEEIQEAFLELDAAETEMLKEKEITVDCPGCGYECNQIHSYCMACGTKLTDHNEPMDA